MPCPGAAKKHRKCAICGWFAGGATTTINGTAPSTGHIHCCQVVESLGKARVDDGVRIRVMGFNDIAIGRKRFGGQCVRVHKVLRAHGLGITMHVQRCDP